MCMLCVVPPNVIPSKSKLENSALNNPHGFGFAIMIPSENRIHRERTMNADTSINRFIEMRKKYPESYAMWHARYATHGTTTLDNCHPFKVGKDNLTYLGHNGILPVQEPTGDTRSDTRIFAEDLLPAIGGVTALDNPQVLNLVEDFTAGSKVCILTLNPKAKKRIYLLHESKGTIDTDKVWWSNDSCYLSTYSNGYGSNYLKPLGNFTYKEEYEEFYICPVCNKENDQEFYFDSQGICDQCGSCADCESHWTECMCYHPEKRDIKKINKEIGGWGNYDF